MQRTRLFDTHVAMGGRMVDFAGWQLPVQYDTGPNREHQAVRTAAGLFDVDHMGQFELRGSEADRFLQFVQVWDVSRMDVYDAHYSLMTYADGTIVDDIFLYRLPERWLIVVNAGNRDKDFEWLTAHCDGFDVTLIDVSDQLYMLALQGPLAERILGRVMQADLVSLPARKALEAEVGGVPALIGRTGYTGEDGFELYFPNGDAPEMWKLLLETGREEGLLPCGLAARDSLRFEACMPLYGHEIDAGTNPLEARLAWVVAWDKHFIGRATLLKTKLENPQRLLVGFEMIDKAVPREKYELVNDDGAVIGFVTTGMRSPTLGKFLGMGFVEAQYGEPGTEIAVVIRGQSKKATIVKRPFYRRGTDSPWGQTVAAQYTGVACPHPIRRVFMTDYKLDSNAKYAKSHEWVRIEDGIAVVGISDAAQDLLSDVVFVELPEAGAQVEAGTDVAVVESVKAAEDVVAPVSGTILEVNGDLEATPELVNESPYEAWFFRIQPGESLESELAALLSPEDYDKFVEEDAG